MLPSIFGRSEEEQADVESTGVSTSNLLPESVQSWWSGDGEENESCFPSMSYQNRLYGFGICFGCGLVLSVLSSFSLATGNLKGFAFIYTTGNVLALFGTSFLVGPMRQVKSMCEQHRIISSSVYLGSLFLTLALAMRGSSIIIIIPVLVIQWCAGIWYTASYIPFARNAISGCVNSTVSAIS